MFKTSLDSSRAKHSKIYLKFKYYYNRWRRQVLPRLVKKVIARQ
jgi:hypothetical protein